MLGRDSSGSARRICRTFARALAAAALGTAWGPAAAAAPPAAGGAAAASPAPPARCVVRSVADAVTLELRCAGIARGVRLGGVRAPRPGGPHEGGEPFAAESRRLAAELLAGAEIELAGGVARLGGEDVRVALLERGLVFVDAAAADGSGLAALRDAERGARSRGAGAWSHAAWRAHQASVTAPVPIAAPPPPPRREPLASRAALPGQPSWEERKAAFEAALRGLERPSSPEARPD